jgi:hypothetical protein
MGLFNEAQPETHLGPQEMEAWKWIKLTHGKFYQNLSEDYKDISPCPVSKMILSK